MIVYSATKKEFSEDVLGNQIEKKILLSFVRETGHSTGKSEVASWQNSMRYMDTVISDSEIPDDVGIAIEYKIPQTSKRIDFILTGTNSENTRTAILIELKQWSEGISMSEKDGIVETKFFGNEMGSGLVFC